MKTDGYPDAPGFNRHDTSIAAAEQIGSDAKTLREAALKVIAGSVNVTTHECAVALRRSVPSIQPRLSELVAKGLIVDSGVRRTNAVSGKKAIAWRLADRQLRLF